MNVSTAKYYTAPNGSDIIGILVTTSDGKNMAVPKDTANSDYNELMRQVAAGDLTIADAD